MADRRLRDLGGWARTMRRTGGPLLLGPDGPALRLRAALSATSHGPAHLPTPVNGVTHQHQRSHGAERPMTQKSSPSGRGGGPPRDRNGGQGSAQRRPSRAGAAAVPNPIMNASPCGRHRGTRATGVCGWEFPSHAMSRPTGEFGTRHQAAKWENEAAGSGRDGKLWVLRDQGGKAKDRSRVRSNGGCAATREGCSLSAGDLLGPLDNGVDGLLRRGDGGLDLRLCVLALFGGGLDGDGAGLLDRGDGGLDL